MGMMETWSIGVAIRATSNVAQMFSQAAVSTNRLNNNISSTNRLLQQQAEIARRSSMLQARAWVSGAAASALTALSVAGVRGAADLQRAMTSVAIATGAANDQMRDFYGLVMRTSGITAQSATTIAQELAVAASSGLNDPRRLTMAFPQIAKAADVMFLGPKHLDPVHSVQQLSQLSHLFGAYSGKPLANMIDAAVRMMYVQPEGLAQLVRQGRMFVPEALGYGVSMQDIFTQAAVMGQTGFLQGRGGSGIARVMEFLMGASSLTNHMSKVRRSALMDLHVFDNQGRLKFLDQDGNLLLGKAVTYLYQLSEHMVKGQFVTDLMNAFGVQGGRYLEAILRPAVQSQMVANAEASHRIAPAGKAVDTMWKAYMGNFWGAWNVALTNAHNVLTTMFLPLLPSMTAGLKALGNELGRLSNWLFTHPKAAAGAAIAAMSAAGAMSAYAVRQIWLLNDAITALGTSAGTAAGAEAAGGTGLFAATAGKFRRFFGFGRPSITGAIYPEVAAAIEPSLFARMLTFIGTKAIPVVGWISVAVTAIASLMDLIRNAPMIVTAVHNWWLRNQYGIGYVIGSGVANTMKLLEWAFGGMFSGLGAMISTFAKNIWELTTPGGQAQLGIELSQSYAASQKAWAAQNPNDTFARGFAQGYQRGMTGQSGSTTFHFEIGSPTLNFGTGTPQSEAKKLAGAIFDEWMSKAHAQAGSTGTHNPTDPFSPPFAWAPQ